MRRPTRTRRLSIAAMVSLLAFLALAGAGVGTLRFAEAWDLGGFRYIGLVSGCLFYTHVKGTAFDPGTDPSGRRSWATGFTASSILKFLVVDIPDKRSGVFIVNVPLWCPLLLLLIIPTSWLIARPADAPAFLVITDAKQSK